jgi:hypothetical protein
LKGLADFLPFRVLRIDSHPLVGQAPFGPARKRLNLAVDHAFRQVKRGFFDQPAQELVFGRLVRKSVSLLLQVLPQPRFQLDKGGVIHHILGEIVIESRQNFFDFLDLEVNLDLLSGQLLRL